MPIMTLIPLIFTLLEQAPTAINEIEQLWNTVAPVVNASPIHNAAMAAAFAAARPAAS